MRCIMSVGARNLTTIGLTEKYCSLDILVLEFSSSETFLKGNEKL